MNFSEKVKQAYQDFRNMDFEVKDRCNIWAREYYTDGPCYTSHWQISNNIIVFKVRSEVVDREEEFCFYCSFLDLPEKELIKDAKNKRNEIYLIQEKARSLYDDLIKTEEHKKYTSFCIKNRKVIDL